VTKSSAGRREVRSGAVVEGAFITVLGGAVLADLGLAWKHRERLHPGRGGAWIQDRRHRRDQRQLELDRQEVVNRANALGIRVAVKVSGFDPFDVEWSDGSVMRRYRSLERHSNDVGAGRADPLTTGPGKAPQPHRPASLGQLTYAALRSERH
jgi:hypothetical protein